MATKINWNEVYFQWWLDELEKVGLVKYYIREPDPLHVMSPLVLYYKKSYKSKKEPIWKSFNANRPLAYTYDYDVLFHESLINKLIAVIDKDISSLWDYSEKYPGTGEFDNVYQETLFFSTKEEIKDGFIKTSYDVKPPAKAIQFSGALASARDFRYNQPLVWQNHSIWVNKVVPIHLFEKTFMPNRFRFTDVSGKPRKIDKQFRTLDQWLSLKKITKIQKQ